MSFLCQLFISNIGDSQILRLNKFSVLKLRVGLILSVLNPRPVHEQRSTNADETMAGQGVGK